MEGAESWGTPVGTRRLPRVASGSSIATNTRINVSKINALRASVDRHSDLVAKVLLSSKEHADKKSAIESAFRACKEAFVEVSSVLINILEDKSVDLLTLDDIKKAVKDTLIGNNTDSQMTSFSNKELACNSQPLSYASVAGNRKNKICVSGGLMLDAPPSTSTSFLIVPKEGNSNYDSSKATREALCKALKPSDCALKINKVTFARNNGIKIDAVSPDIDLIKMHPGLVKAGLKVIENVKLNPRLIMYNVPVEMTAEEIVEEIIAQNLADINKIDIKVVYTYPAKPDNRTTSCVLEVSPLIRNILLKRGRIYLRYSACKFTDYVRVLQCYNCMTFGHLAKFCKSKPTCGLCSNEHLTKDCGRKDMLKCGNCMRNKSFSSGDLCHSAFDTKKCPILNRKITDKISYINYG
ncbi:uncharacterized protein LOC109860075 [Pseudomyrmex gracilis]|uniref:uncharacterized protein LOC109860075 n=1 Tax=Pseudomyrmex gracilis TaxID=219809 RepID=UPI000995390E|nr:uncharacterized protein LOC109860075 [Pseudomyrmex gracilis]